MTLFLTALFAGLAVGSVYGLIALSYTVVFNSTAIFNIAQGDLMMAGVLVAYFCLDRWHLAQILSPPPSCRRAPSTAATSPTPRRRIRPAC